MFWHLPCLQGNWRGRGGGLYTQVTYLDILTSVWMEALSRFTILHSNYTGSLHRHTGQKSKALIDAYTFWIYWRTYYINHWCIMLPFPMFRYCPIRSVLANLSSNRSQVSRGVLMGRAASTCIVRTRLAKYAHGVPLGGRIRVFNISFPWTDLNIIFSLYIFTFGAGYSKWAYVHKYQRNCRYGT